MTGKFADALTTGAPTTDALTADALTAGAPATGAAAGIEGTLAEVLAGVMHTEQVPAAATSSMSWAPTRWSWPTSAPGSGNAGICRRYR